MAFHVPQNSQKPRELPPEGNHYVVCYSIVDLGTQWNNNKGKEQSEIRISWEFMNELMSDGRPFVIGKTYNFSSHPSSALVLDLESWRGQGFDCSFDLEELLGMVAAMHIKHGVGPNGNYAGFTSVIKPPNGVPERRSPRNPSVLFTLSAYDDAVYRSLPNWLQNKIAQSREFKAVMRGEPVPAASRPYAQPARAAAPRGDLDDDIPF
jgi:hypothetical protein